MESESEHLFSFQTIWRRHSKTGRHRAPGMRFPGTVQLHSSFTIRTFKRYTQTHSEKNTLAEYISSYQQVADADNLERKTSPQTSARTNLFHGIHLFCKANAGRNPQTSHFLSLPFHFKSCKLCDLCSVIPSATNKQNIKAVYLS